MATKYLGATLGDLGKHDEAIEVLSSLLQVVKQALGEDHIAVLDTLEELAEVYSCQGQYDQAIVQLQCAVDTSASINGLRDAVTVCWQSTLGSAQLRAGRLVEAESVLRNSVDMHREVFGDFDYRLAISKEFFGIVLHRQGQLEEAILLYDEAVSIVEAIQGPASPDATKTRLRASKARQKLSRQAATTPCALTTVGQDGRGMKKVEIPSKSNCESD